MSQHGNLDKARLTVSAVLPAFNEEASLEGVVRDLIEALEPAAEKFEVIIVDDGSVDRTPEIADELARERKPVRVVRHESNLGYGAALVSGFRAATMDWIFFMDADGQFDPAQIMKLASLTNDHEFIAGFREQRADPFHRVLYGRLFSAAIRVMFGVKAKDVNCAFKLFRKNLIEGHEFMSGGALINAELLAVARMKGLDPKEVPVSHRPRLHGASTGGSARVILRAVIEILKLRMGLKS